MERAPTVYQLKVSIRQISPMIWRRFLVTDEMTLYQLHRVLQIGFGWEDYHLHEFDVHGWQYHTERTGQRHRKAGGQEMSLVDLKLRVRQKIIYEYDFGDRWVHEIRVEGKKEFDPKKFYPTCIGGARSGPPEDSGGAGAYLEFLDRRPIGSYDDGFDLFEEDEMLDDFDPEYFSRREINAELKEEWHPVRA